jgi:hypothetical protein
VANPVPVLTNVIVTGAVASGGDGLVVIWADTGKLNNISRIKVIFFIGIEDEKGLTKQPAL